MAILTVFSFFSSFSYLHCVLLMEDGVCQFGLCRKICGRKHSPLELRFVQLICRFFFVYDCAVFFFFFFVTVLCCNGSGTNWILSINTSGISRI